MPVRQRTDNQKWVYRTNVKLPDGTTVRIFGTPAINTKAHAQEAERAHIERVLKPSAPPVPKKEVPTYGKWFWGIERDSEEPNGAFWMQWVVANRNKASECRTKKYIYKSHLRDRFESVPLDQIDADRIATLRAELVASKLSAKRINNVMAVLSKSLRWAEEVGVIPSAPRIRFHKIDRPEIEFYDFNEYARVLAAAKRQGPQWYAAVCLAGEAGLRVGEIKALRWREDIDMTAKTVTVNQQVLRGVFGTPKGRTRRTIPMTSRLYEGLKALSVVRDGLLLRRDDGKALTDSHAAEVLYRICRLAGLPTRGWHILRHSFATHSAMFGINPWMLNAWMGHKAMEETMRYVHIAENHQREIPTAIQEAAAREIDFTRRVLASLSERGAVPYGTEVALTAAPKEKVREFSLVS